MPSARVCLRWGDVKHPGPMLSTAGDGLTGAMSQLNMGHPHRTSGYMMPSAFEGASSHRL